MDAVKFSEQIVIDSSSEAIFDFAQDYQKRLQWDSFLKKADLIEGAAQGSKGVKALCVAKNGLGMVTEYITFDRPFVTAIKMTKGPFLFESFLGSWNFRKISADKTEVIFLYSFALRFPFNLATILIKRKLQKNVKQRLVDLKRNVENERSQTSSL